jgi:GspD-like, N0 domain
MTFPLFLTSRRCLGSLLFALLLLCPLRAVWATQEVSFSFENTDISTVIKKVGEFTKTTFLFNPELVKGKLTLLAPQKVSPQAALRLLQSALALHGYRMVRKAAGTWIVPAGQGPVETLIEVVPLQYARVDELAYTLSWVAPEGGYGSCRMFPPIASSSQETQKRCGSSLESSGPRRKRLASKVAETRLHQHRLARSPFPSGPRCPIGAFAYEAVLTLSLALAQRKRGNLLGGAAQSSGAQARPWLSPARESCPWGQLPSWQGFTTAHKGS